MSTGRRPTSASRTTEVRNLDPQDAQMLGHILDTLEGWEQLMKCIPRAQSGPATFDNPHHFKYSFNDICKIREAGQESRQYNATQILFDEWGTSGRIRPTLGHLMQLLVQSNLYRAADYLAVEILKEEPPARPSTGIAARVDITLPTPPEPTVAPVVPLPAQVADAAAIPLIQIQTDHHRNGVPPSQRTDAPNLNRTASKAGPSLVQKLNDHISDFIEFSRAQQLAREQGIDGDDGDDDNSYDDQMPKLSIFQDSDDVAKSAAAAVRALSAVNGNAADEPATASDDVLPHFSSLLQLDAGSSRSQPVPVVDSFAPAFTSLLDQRPDGDGAGVSDSSAAVRGNVDGEYATTMDDDLIPALSQLQMAASSAASFNMPDLSGLGNSTTSG